MTFEQLVSGKKTLLFDGAMGTYFASLPGRAEERCEAANLTHPEEILNIHREYLEAGSRAIRTNTFDLSVRFGEDEAFSRRILSAGCALAKEAAEAVDGALVFADLGPAPHWTGHSAAEVYMRQAELFLAEGLRCFTAETLPTDDGIAELARFLKREAPDSFLLVSFAVWPDGVTREGLPGRALLERCAALEEIDAVGFNCVSGPHHMLELVRSLDRSALHGKPLSVIPNAGYPSVLGRRTAYQGSPDYFAGQLGSIVSEGVQIAGGCCGTTPRHIRAFSVAVRSGAFHPASVQAPRPEADAREQGSVNSLREKLQAGKRVIAVEFDPPADDRDGEFLEGVRALRDAGADTVTISDCPVGRPRADSCLLACRLHRELGVEPLPHMTCRDRNLNALKALLLGLSIDGVHNVLLVTGDPIPAGNREEVKSVFNFNSRKLIRFVRSLEGAGINVPFQIFAALNVNAPNFATQLAMAKAKEATGADGFLTQPVHSAQALENLARAREELHGKLLGGVFPIVSHRNALFLNNEVAGIHIPEELIARYEGLDRAAGEALALETSVGFAREMRPYTDGLYLMTPFRRVELIRRIMAEVRE